MHSNWPLRWPRAWRDPALLDLLQGTPPGFLLLPSAEGYGDIAARAHSLGIAACDIGHPPPGVRIAKGEWPGVRMATGQGDATSGPTGAPWVDSNGWLVRLERARMPDATVWVTADAPPTTEILPLSRHLVALADSAAHGGHWVVTLDHHAADGLAAGAPEAAGEWKKLMRAAAFFQAHDAWRAWPADAVLAVVSSFAEDDAPFSREVLNLMARTNISYAIVEDAGVTPAALRGLRAVLYPDAGPPPAATRQALLDFAARGGLLIAGPRWNQPAGPPEPEQAHPRYQLRRLGKGVIAMARRQPDDPYEMTQDAQLILSHRYDRVRLFNGFLLSGYGTLSPDGTRKLVHLVNYGGGAGGDPPAAHIAGRFRAAKLWPLGRAEPQRLDMLAQRDGVEVHLPPIDVYSAIELEILEHA